MGEQRRLSWAAVWLAIALIAIKAFYLGAPAAATLRAGWDYARDLTAVSFIDVLFAAMFWVCGSAALMLAAARPRLSRAIVVAAIAAATLSCLYALASVFFF